MSRLQIKGSLGSEDTLRLFEAPVRGDMDDGEQKESDEEFAAREKKFRELLQGIELRFRYEGNDAADCFRLELRAIAMREAKRIAGLRGEYPKEQVPALYVEGFETREGQEERKEIGRAILRAYLVGASGVDIGDRKIEDMGLDELVKVFDWFRWTDTAALKLLRAQTPTATQNLS